MYVCTEEERQRRLAEAAEQENEEGEEKPNNMEKHEEELQEKSKSYSGLFQVLTKSGMQILLSCHCYPNLKARHSACFYPNPIHVLMAIWVC